MSILTWQPIRALAQYSRELDLIFGWEPEQTFPGRDRMCPESWAFRPVENAAVEPDPALEVKPEHELIAAMTLGARSFRGHGGRPVNGWRIRARRDAVRASRKARMEGTASRELSHSGGQRGQLTL